MPRWQKVAAGATLLVLITAIVGAVWLVKTSEPRLHRELERWLAERLNSDVSVEAVTVRLFPTVRLEGAMLVLRIKGRPDLPPFITVRRFTGTGVLTGLYTRRLDEVRLDDMEIVVPPGRKADLEPFAATGDAPAGVRRARTPVVDRLVADAVTITVMPRDADRDPVVWDVRDLVMQSFSLDAETPFTATVDTPLPTDRALVSGRAGPWPQGDFGLLPLSGEFTFEGDLGDIPGVTGRITASGDGLGTLERIAFTGSAESDAVGLESGATPGHLPMSSSFEVVLDGTSGDLYVTRVTTTLASSTFETSGQVTRTRGVRGRRVRLAVRTPDPADVGDVMRLLVDGGRPPLAGRLSLEASLDLPPGEADVLDRLVIDGAFRMSGARFANLGVQERVDDLARRGQGRPEDPEIARVAADMRGRVVLRHHDLTLRELHFTVPGATIDASGSYGLRSEELQFRGVARLEASMSRTQTGAKRTLLRPLDPLLRKEGAGTRLVLDIRGTKSDPQVDLDLGASLRGRR